MKRFALFLLTISTIITGYAQNEVKAKEILDQLSKKTKTFTTISADFSFTLENLQEEITETYAGHIDIKGSKYKVSLMDVNTYFDGTTIWTHMIDAEEVNVSEPDLEDESTLNPATIFTMYEKGFNYLYVGESTIGNKVVHEIDLFPALRDKPYSRIKLFIDKNALQLVSIKQIGKDGNNYTIKVKNMKTNNALPDTLFTFNKSQYPDVDVIDMR